MATVASSLARRSIPVCHLTERQYWQDPGGHPLRPAYNGDRPANGIRLDVFPWRQHSPKRQKV